MEQSEKKFNVARAALDYIEHGCVLGVGTGSTVNILIDALPTIRGRIQSLERVAPPQSQRIVEPSVSRIVIVFGRHGENGAPHAVFTAAGVISVRVWQTPASPRVLTPVPIAWLSERTSSVVPMPPDSWVR